MRGSFPLLLICLTLFGGLPDLPERPKSVRRLSYSSVPGMDTGSRLFHKAQAVIAKQALPARKTQLDRLISFDAGELTFCIGLAFLF